MPFFSFQSSFDFNAIFHSKTNNSLSSYYGYAFDGVYALAKALDDVSYSANLEDFKYK